MHPISIGASILVNTLMVSAVPTGTVDLVPRACVTEYPTIYNNIDQFYANRSDNENFFDTYNGYFEGNHYRHDQLVRFDNIPANSFGCQLEAAFPAFPELQVLGKTRVNAFTVDRDVTELDTWENSPQPVSLFGTADFTLDTTQPSKLVFNSGVCKPTLSFRFSLETTTELGDVLFYPRQEGPGLPGSGIRITHNC